MDAIALLPETREAADCCSFQSNSSHHRTVPSCPDNSRSGNCHSDNHCCLASFSLLLLFGPKKPHRWFCLHCGFWLGFFCMKQFSKCPVGLLAGLGIVQEEQCGQCPGCCLAPCSEEYLFPTLCMQYSCKYTLLLLANIQGMIHAVFQIIPSMSAVGYSFPFWHLYVNFFSALKLLVFTCAFSDFPCVDLEGWAILSHGYWSEFNICLARPVIIFVGLGGEVNVCGMTLYPLGSM